MTDSEHSFALEVQHKEEQKDVNIYAMGPIGGTKEEFVENPSIPTVLPKSENLTADDASIHLDTSNLSHLAITQPSLRPTNYCGACATPKPARTTHCFRCKHCVTCYDHHSIWVNNCIGEVNRKYYFIAILSLLVQSVMAIRLVYIRLNEEIAFPVHVILLLLSSVLVLIILIPSLL